MIKRVKSNLSHLRVIESTTWVHIRKEKTKKLDYRSWKRVLVSYENDNQYRIYDSRTDKVHIVRDVKIDENVDNNNDDSDDDFWTHEDDKLLNSNFEVQDSGTATSSKRPALKPKTVDNRVVSPDLRIGNFDSVKAIDEPVNALD
jgi:hypothetical protein